MWEIEYYKNSRGEEEIFSFLSSLRDMRCRVAIFKQLEYLKNLGPYVLMGRSGVEKIGSNLYELRCNFGKSNFRILFGVNGYKILAALIFLKKTNKINIKYIKLAIKRINEVL